ncbi:MAG: (d)CMP kinase [Ruminococcaceae bacterium]|nr:(d)CMP kinase [Oscillospiraceae bacterium]
MVIKIAIDGPSGAGKSTLSKKLAKELGFVYIDTGAMYRAAGLFCLRNGINIKEESDKAADCVEKITIDIIYLPEEGQKVILNGDDVTGEIRTPEVSIAASDVSAIKRVRLRLVELQREMAKSHNVLMDGRDIGTYVLPDADIKIFLTASNEERAKRRYAELLEKGQKCEYEDVYRDMLYRDKNDSSREFAPLKAAEDSIMVDTTGNTFEESFELLLNLIRERL